MINKDWRQHSSVRTSASAPALSWTNRLRWVGVAALILMAGGVTVFASARIMMSSHELSKIQSAQARTEQEIRFLHSDFAQASSLEKVRQYALENNLEQTVRFAGVISATVPVAQRTQ